MTEQSKYKVRFFFDYGAGGCLWADNELATKHFGFGPLDETIAEKTGKISANILKKIAELDTLHATYYNQNYPPDPSLWRQSDCDKFNDLVDSLLSSLMQELLPDFEIVDKQIRYSEDDDLDEYLKDIKNFRRSK
jgi:hypothetical protein